MNKLRVAAIAMTAAWCAAAAQGSPIAYAFVGEEGGYFGTIDLGTGIFTSISVESTEIRGLGVVGGNLYGAAEFTTTLYQFNTTTGGLTAIGSSGVAGINYDLMGSDLSTLYAVDTNGNLYSVNPATGAATLIGPIGVGLVGNQGLSDNSSTLYLSDGPNLYTLNTTTGAATLVGSFGFTVGGVGGVNMGALLLDGGTLYGGENSPSDAIYTIDPTTGASTPGPAVTGDMGYGIIGLAVLNSTSTPEPAAILLVGAGLVALIIRRQSTLSRMQADRRIART